VAKIRRRSRGSPWLYYRESDEDLLPTRWRKKSSLQDGRLRFEVEKKEKSFYGKSQRLPMVKLVAD
jgi:hypothetical protein